MGAFLSTFLSLSATKLGSISIESALKRANVDPSLMQEVLFGNVMSVNLGQAPARKATLGVGITNTVVFMDVNKACSSGMKGIGAVKPAHNPGPQVFCVSPSPVCSFCRP